ncbi:hypothetical protein P153DRAFT_371732 [Dothidotthia symphoricarpi CBS 119687]|uniref:GPI anchored protein n=1 Tax=Dothidotthia symphoricarpi CBS 119687 TaxID=1392245 RepID=A0A6A5ZUL8_9PLEO|nr:uncharacterized protein P153DRAFT_371732 [Dothidotthia symphoricarpi CBS 119687]KAF2123412.1 hypothetical protein P153DRAFT_371732 [Dothidotthia symphoricarpi CBS 119687]
MRQSVVLVSLLASTTLAQDVVSFFFPGGYEGDAPVATIKTANPSTTAMHIACATGVDATECGFGTGVDVRVISGTSFEGTMSAETYTMSYNCDYNTKAVEMTCTADMTGQDPQTAVLSGSDVAFVPATVVQGAELLKETASATAASATASMTSSLASATSTGIKTSASVASGASAAVSSHVSGSASTPTASGSAATVSTGAAAGSGIERSTLLALVGAAVVALW